MGRIERYNSRIVLVSCRCFPIWRLHLQLDRAKPRSMSKRCSDEPLEASFFHGGRWVSIDEETRPIRTRRRIGTVSIPIFRCRSTVCPTHGAPAAGRRFVRREFARQPLLRETQQMGGGVLSRVQPFLGVAPNRDCFETEKLRHKRKSERERDLRSCMQCVSRACTRARKS
jgi:hypothetical protein